MGWKTLTPPGVKLSQCLLGIAAGLFIGIAATMLYQQLHHDDADPVVARWQGGEVRASEAFATVRGQLSNLLDDGYRAKKKAIDDLIGQRLLEAESAKEKIPVDAVIAKHSEGAVAKPTDAEIETFLASRGLNMRDRRAHKEDVRTYMTYLRRVELKDAYVAKLKEAAKVRIHLAEPELPRIDVALDHFPSWGSDHAPITLVEFSDFESPEAARVSPVLARIRKELGPDKVKMVYRDMPGGSHAHAVEAALAAHCADEQGKFWEYHDTIFANQTKLTNSDLLQYARNLTLDTAQFSKCLSTRKYRKTVDASRSDAKTAGIRMSPSFLINGSILQGAVSYDRLMERVQRELGGVS